jgi:hypothetical protein
VTVLAGSVQESIDDGRQCPAGYLTRILCGTVGTTHTLSPIPTYLLISIPISTRKRGPKLAPHARRGFSAWALKCSVADESSANQARESGPYSMPLLEGGQLAESVAGARFGGGANPGMWKNHPESVRSAYDGLDRLGEFA